MPPTGATIPRSVGMMSEAIVVSRRAGAALVKGDGIAAAIRTGIPRWELPVAHAEVGRIPGDDPDGFRASARGFLNLGEEGGQGVFGQRSDMLVPDRAVGPDDEGLRHAVDAPVERRPAAATGATGA